ncbi:hypothetical protein M422DRAFT_220707 [Sphaerobolus stellatus SS14]|nr:hypothetical protein M422DRAFT_220707 [Sphaerobolus stellatus SS14]
MPPQSTSSSIHLLIQPSTFYLVQFKASEPIPPSIIAKLVEPGSGTTTKFLSVTRTDEEVSIVSDFVLDAGELDGETKREVAKWLCMKVAGPMNLGLTGIMNDLTTPLKAAKIPIFAISTWDTDFLLVPEEKGPEAAEVMRKDGWTVKTV